jgi:hypothetical protein
VVTNAAEAVESELKAIDAVNWKRNKNDKRIASTSSLSQFCKEGCEMLC